MHLLIHPETTYSALLVAFPTLYQELMDVKPEHLLFLIFYKAQPKACILQLLDESWPTINIRPHIIHFRRLVFSYTE